MQAHVLTTIKNHIGIITLARPKALNSLSLEMVRAMTATLRAWHNDPAIRAVFIHSSSEKAFCAGGDIRFFYEASKQTGIGDKPQLEDFFTEEYALNHLIHFYPKPYIALMNGVVMGGGMGISQSGVASRLRIVTERTKMAMPEVNIGLFPDVGGGYFLNRTAGAIGTYLALTGEIIGAADALYADLADIYIPTSEISALMELLAHYSGSDARVAIRHFAAPFASQLQTAPLESHRNLIDQHFSHNTMAAIYSSLEQHESAFAKSSLATMATRSPLFMAITLEQLRRCKNSSL
ncbi:MAG: enoyl-CoA hydratase/isomerase family protein, partial [Undibacterium sp.]|nr:enoyl-CoA hydratase/isomerase family protein [Undibacterium sp.]